MIQFRRAFYFVVFCVQEIAWKLFEHLESTWLADGTGMERERVQRTRERVRHSLIVR